MSDVNVVCVGPTSEQAGIAPSCAGCPNAAICAAGPKAPDPDLEVMRSRLKDVKHVVLVLSGKGGVGKSTVTKEVAFGLGRQGLFTAMVDMDICGPSLPRLTGVRAEDIHHSAGGIEPVSVDDNVVMMSMHFLLGDRNEAVVMRGPQKNSIIKTFLKDVIWGDVDLMLIDTPPGTTDEHISTVSFLQQCARVDGAIIVTTPQAVAEADVRREIGFCKKTNIPILGIVENMSGFQCPKCHQSSTIFPSQKGVSAGDRLSAEFGLPLWARIPLTPALMTACEEGAPLIDLAPDGDAAVPAIAHLINKLTNSLLITNTE